MTTRVLIRWLIAVIWWATPFALAYDAAAAPLTYTVTSTDGVKLAVQESGDPDGVPVILIHGLLGSRLNWDPQVQSPDLRGFRIITYDLRGHGLSDKPSGAQPYRDSARGRRCDPVRRPVQGSLADSRRQADAGAVAERVGYFVAGSRLVGIRDG